MQFKAFKNFEDNIEFLAKDIKEMDDKIKEVEQKLFSLKERDSGYKIDGIPINCVCAFFSCSSYLFF